MSASKVDRPTPQSLPRLKIPKQRHHPEPEEITMSRAEGFLEYCRKNKRAPITRLPSIPLIPPPGPDSDLSLNEGSHENIEDLQKLSQLNIVNTPDTLAFTDNEQDELEARKAELVKVKEKHTEYYLEIIADPKDREATRQCKHWRQIRERLNLEISIILERREMRRKFRKEFNHVPGVTNW
ncbi:hypothetical protein F4819DRAFT_503187 [Hypoxylon fuscum]|nr:hypothetical protein F4819DRAFT_503187 [Hypoxylon fuscum]